jgi:hypothetical protein
MNSFLNDFVKMRKNLHENIIIDATKKKEVKPVDVKGTDITIQTIIDKKPNYKKVLNYFKNLYNCK